MAAIVRAIGLDAGLWFDEIYSLVHSFRRPLATVVTVFSSDNQHPFYAVLANRAIAVFGESNWAIRLPAALFGVATVPLLYAFGRRVTAEDEALLASALLAVAYHHVWFSQNARGYALLLFFALAASLCLVAGLRDPRGRWVAGYAVAAGLGAYTHLTMLFVVIGHALVVIAALAARLRRRQPIRRELALAIGSFGGAAIVTLALYAPMLRQVLSFFLGTRSHLEGLATPSWAAGETARVLGVGLGGALGVAAAGIVVALGLVSYARRDALVAGLFVVPAAVTVVGSMVGRATIYPRFFFALAGFAILIAVRGVMEAARLASAALPRWRGRPELGRRTATVALAIAVAASAVPTLMSLGRPKQDYVGAARWVDRHVPPEDRVVTVGVTNVPYQRWMPRPWTPIPGHQLGDLSTLRQDGKRTWIVYAFPRFLASSNPDVLRAIREECGPVERFPGTLGGGDLMVCALRPSVASVP